MKVINQKVIVEGHEWARSLRTSGMPVYAGWVSQGKLHVVEIGRTQKRPAVYQLPSQAEFVLREYWTNSGWRILYYYPFPTWEPLTLREGQWPAFLEEEGAIGIIAHLFFFKRWEGEGVYSKTEEGEWAKE